MTGEKVTFEELRTHPDGCMVVEYSVTEPPSRIGKPTWEPTEEDRQCMLDELVGLLSRMEVVVIPIANAEVMFHNDSELIAFVRPYNFTVHFNTFQKSFVCTLQNKIGE